MGGTKFLKRTLAFLLAVSMMLTQMSFSDFGTLTARAEDEVEPGSWVATNYIVNGDFEDGTNDWTFDDTGAECTVESNEWASSKTNNYLNVWTENANTNISVSQTISLPAGKYYFTFQNAGDAKASILTTTLGSTSVTHSAMKGWDTYGMNTSPEFVLENDGDYTLTIAGTGTSSTANYYEKIDNIILYQWQLPPEYSFADLETLIASVPTDYLTIGFTTASTTALTDALTAANLCTDGSSGEDIVAAYEALNAALGGLVFDSDIFVKKVSDYDTDSIRGVDVSSYIALMNTFDELNSEILADADKFGFRDFEGNLLDRQGFFNLLADSGVNYIRLRVWNDPYLSTDNTKGYGGGNNDLDKAIEMGKYATLAGMQVLIDFHFSDFWADPGKQKAPKAWATKTTDEKATAISEMVTESLTKLITDNNVDVGMVQIGNETTAGMSGASGTDMYTLFKAGCAAVKDFNTANATSVLAAIHFTNPEKGNYPSYAQKLKDNGVDYDVFASSYYPFWHGTMSNLTTVLNNIASTYGVYVMVAETSWAYTYEDGDGHENTIKNSSQIGTSVNYGVSIQDQAKEVRDVIAAVSNVTAKVKGKKAGIGVFYWEPAWIPVQYAYDESGDLDSSIYDSNKLLWEEFGSGWASSYATEYDAADAGLYFGGSSWDNQAMFDFNGNPLSSLNVYNYVVYGSEAPLAISSYSCDAVSVEVGASFTAANLPTNVTINYNDDSVETPTVEWNEADIANVAAKTATNAGIGAYTINGTAATIVNPSYAVSCTVNIIPKNLLANSSFEESGSWTVTGTGCTIRSKNASDSRTGEYNAKLASGANFTFSQTVTATTDGLYYASIYAQGLSGTGGNANERIYLSVTNNASGETFDSSNISLIGWPTFVPAIVTNIKANAGDTLTFTFHLKVNSGAWGTIDDATLYLDKALLLSDASATMEYGSEKQLTATHTYAAENSGITWTSSDDSVASVDGTGKITATGVGTATITATTDDSYELVSTCAVTVTEISLAEAIIAISNSSYDFDNTAKEPTVDSVTLKGNTLTPGDDYTVSYSANTNAGTATVTVTGNGNYKDTATTTFTINAVSLATATITLAQTTYTYDGEAKEPAITEVDLDGTTLVAGTDYTPSYSDNTENGTATVTITGKNNYLGTASETFTISKAPIADAVITLEEDSYTYDGSAKTPAVTSVVLNGKTLTVTDEYTIGYSANTAVGTATVTITGEGNYTGTATTTFAINKISMTGATIVLAEDSYDYDGTAKTPAVTSVTVNGELLTVTDDYTIDYSSNTDAGTATVTITGAGNYEDTETATFTINSISLAAADVTLLEDTYTYDGTAKEPGVDTVILNGVTLIPDTDYSISYSDNTDVGVATVTITGEGNYNSTATATFDINSISLTGASITLIGDTYTYDGTAKTPAIVDILVDGESVAVTADDIDIDYSDNTNAGEATVTITAKGANCTGEASTTFTINSFALTGATVTLATNSYTYDGSAKTPAVTSIVSNGVTLETSSDYNISYSNNTNAGNTATVTLTTKNGNENCTGTATKTFTINKASINGAVVTLKTNSYTYNGTEKKPEINTITVAGKTLTTNDYSIGYSKNKDAGTATVTITGKGNYNGTVTKTFTITKATKSIKGAKATISKVQGDKAFSLGATVTSGEKPTYALSNTKVVSIDKNGKVTIKGCGTVVVTVKSAASTNYSAAKDVKVTITVKPKKATMSSPKSKKSGQLIVTWSKDTKVTGYEVYYSTKSNFKGVKAKKITSNKTTTKTYTGLSKGKKYYVKVRSYTTVGGKTVYGDYSAVKTVTVKK